MIILYKKKPILGFFLFLVISSLFIVFFALQIYRSGDLQEIQKNKEILAMKLENYQEVKAELLLYDKYSKSLSPNSLDYDFLEEEARKKLMLTKENEIVIFRDDK